MSMNQPSARRTSRALLLVLAASMIGGLGRPQAQAVVTASIGLQQLASGISNLTDIQNPGDGSGRLFLVEQSGRIRIFSGGQVSATPFLDVSSLTFFSGEQGLLGLAFHPQYATNGIFFIHYTSSQNVSPGSFSRTVIARYHVSSDPNVADTAGQILLTQDQPFSNHKGGQIRFGPDGFLYIALGDGGSGGDPLDNGQNLNTMLGKLLRIDVNNFASSTYAIPPNNPFAASARPEIWAYGLRNPWRFSFDRLNGDLFVGDVGQGLYEEVNYQPAGTPGGRNYGWRRMEGMHCYDALPSCDFGTLPVMEYSHSFGCSITGGFRYRGAALPALAGVYLFADYCSGVIWGAAPDATGIWRATRLTSTSLNISAFGEDASGELYIADYTAGALYRIVAVTDSTRLLSVSTTGSGSGRVSSNPLYLDCGSLCGTRLPSGTAVTLTTQAGPGSTFVGWTGDADCSDGAVTLSADRHCIARFGGGFTDDEMTAGVTTIRAVHITELRDRINAQRVRYGLLSAVWTDPVLTAGSTLIRATHIIELRAAVTDAYVAAGRTPPSFTTPGLSSGDAIRAVHIRELRSAVLLLEP